MGWWWAGLVLASFWEWESRQPGPSPAQQCESSPYLSQDILCLPTKKPIPEHLRCGARPCCSALSSFQGLGFLEEGAAQVLG